MRASRNAPGRPEPPSRDRPANTAAKPVAGLTSAVSVQQHHGDGLQQHGTETCSRCGHDLVSMLRQVLAERHQAWQAGVLEGYGTGWRDGLLAGVERRSAA
jgi:hypothetical protein